MIDSYSKLPLGKYLDILKLNEDKEMTDIDRTAHIIGILNGMTFNEVMNLPIAEFKRLSASASFLERELPKMRVRILKKYNLGGMELTATTNITQLTTAQYVDFKTFAQDNEHLVELLSVFLVPKGMKYNDGYDVTEVHAAIRNEFPVDEAIKMSAFFLSKLETLMRTTLIYSRLMLKKTPKGERRTELMERIQELETSLKESGVGLIMSAMWQRPRIHRGIMFGE